jgi:acyl-CoA thioesterase
VLDGDDLDLVPVGDAEHPERIRYRGHVPLHWCLEDRAFGGFTGALALAAMLQHAGADAAASLHIVFVHPGRHGPIEVAVERVRQGRTASAWRADVIQGGRTIVEATAWMSDAWATHARAVEPLDTGRTVAPDVVPAPQDCPPLDWLIEDWPSLRFAERRAIRYPAGWDTFASGRPEVALWVRIPHGDEGSPVHPQVGDVLHADAHLFDAPAQITGFAEVSVVSLDLSLSWVPGAALVPADRWRCLDNVGAVGEIGISATGTISLEDGSRLATVTSQGLLR